jgi:hypothetical protein
MHHAATMTPGPQHLRALERANRVRLARAELKKLVSAGELSAADVVERCPWEAESMTLSELITSQRRWGSTRCRKFLAALHLPELKELGTLTERQRRELVGALHAATAPAQARELTAA